MKTFTHFLLESTQTYDFKIKIACAEMDDDAQDRLEHALKAFDLATISKPKRLPPGPSLDFPRIGECDVFLVNVVLKSPCTDDQLRTTISNQGRFPLANVVVVPKNQPEELRRDEDAANKDGAKKEAILTKDLEAGVDGQPLVGAKRLDSMLKELETRKMEFAAKEKTPAPKTSNDSPQNNKSPVTGRKGKIT